MKVRELWITLLTVGVVSGMVNAQPPGPPPGPPPGQWGGGSTFRHTAKMRLTLLIAGLGELEKGKKAPLTRDQARRITALIAPWQKKTSMDEEQAKTLYKKLNDVLTTRQKNELDRLAAQRRRFNEGEGGFGRSGRSGGPGGAPFDPQREQQMRERVQNMREFQKVYNPFLSPFSYKEFKRFPPEMRDNVMHRYEARKEILNSIRKKASGK